MTRDETKKIIMIITYTFPNYKPQDLSMAVDIWNDMLSDYSYEQVSASLKAFIATDTSGFAPSVGQLIEKIHSLNPGEKKMNANESWALVYKALCNSNYHAQEEFEKLPPLVQKAVGSADNLRSLASSSDFNEEVEKSLFTKTYNAICKREEENARLPESIRIALKESEKWDGLKVSQPVSIEDTQNR